MTELVPDVPEQVVTTVDLYLLDERGNPRTQTLDVGVPVMGAQALVLYAIDSVDVFETAEEAAAPVCLPNPPPITTFGGIAWTAHGPIEVVWVGPDFVVTTTYTKLSTGAAAMAFVEHADGPILVDAGAQIPRSRAVQALEQAAILRVTELAAGRPLRVLLTHAHADHINLLPRLAEVLVLGSIEIPAEQANRPLMRRTLRQVWTAVETYRNETVPTRVRADLAGQRAAFLAEQSAAVRVDAGRAAAAWDTYVEQQVRTAQAAVRPPDIELLIGTENGSQRVRAQIATTATEVRATAPPSPARGFQIHDVLRAGGVTTFTHPEADARPLGSRVDAHSANYVVDLPRGSQLVVTADPRDRDMLAVRRNFSRAMQAAGFTAEFRLMDVGHHGMGGFMSRTGGPPGAGHLVARQTLVDLTVMLSELVLSRGESGQPTQNAVVVSGTERRVSPANAWFFRDLGFEVYTLTSPEAVELVSILERNSGETSTGIVGEPDAGGRPPSPLSLRAGLSVSALNSEIAMLEGLGVRTEQQAERLEQATTDRARTRRLLHEYLDAMDHRLARSPGQTARPTVAPENVAIAGAQARALTLHLDAIGAAQPAVSAAGPLPESILVLIDRTGDRSLSPARAEMLERVQRVGELNIRINSPDPLPDGLRLELLLEMETLKPLLETEVRALTGEHAALMQRQIDGLTRSIASLRSAIRIFPESQPDPAGGGRGRTQLMAEQPIQEGWSPGRQRLERGFGLAGRAMGAVMVMHAFTAADDFDHGDHTDLEALAGTLHTGHTFAVGIRMASLVKVNFAEFVVMAILDFTRVASADYESEAQRDLAMAHSGISHVANLAMFALGGALMRSGHPATALAGFALMFMGGPIVSFLDYLGLFDAIERWVDFDPNDVVGVRQQLQDLFAEYRVIVGAIELARRDQAELTRLGATDPADVQAAAQSAIALHRQEALQIEPALLAQFSEGYEAASTDHSGLQGLDAYREAFAAMHRRVWQDTEQWEEQDSAVERAFLGFESVLDLSNASEATIKGMEQWSDLDTAMDGLHYEIFHGSGPYFWSGAAEQSAVLEESAEIEAMFTNARYRLNPSAYGPYRSGSMLGDGDARRSYEAELLKREIRWSRFLARFDDLASDATLLPVQPWAHNPPQPATAHAHEEQLEPGFQVARPTHAVMERNGLNIPYTIQIQGSSSPDHS